LVTAVVAVSAELSWRTVSRFFVSCEQCLEHGAQCCSRQRQCLSVDLERRKYDHAQHRRTPPAVLQRRSQHQLQPQQQLQQQHQQQQQQQLQQQQQQQLQRRFELQQQLPEQ